MPGPAVGNQNRSVHVAVRELAASYFQSEGFDVHAKRHHARLSDALSDDILAPDLAGLPGAHVVVTSRLQRRLSSDLDAARRAADINGTPIAALVQWRPERDIREAYVTLTAADFAKLVRGDHRT